MYSFNYNFALSGPLLGTPFFAYNFGFEVANTLVKYNADEMATLIITSYIKDLKDNFSPYYYPPKCLDAFDFKTLALGHQFNDAVWDSGTLRKVT